MGPRNDQASNTTVKKQCKSSTTKRIVNQYDFNLIWWNGVELEIRDFPKLLWNFITKQVSKFCNTHRQLSRTDAAIKSVCPSCGKTYESSKHFTHCTDEGPVAMLNHSVCGIRFGEWKQHLPMLIKHRQYKYTFFYKTLSGWLTVCPLIVVTWLLCLRSKTSWTGTTLSKDKYQNSFFHMCSKRQN